MWKDLVEAEKPQTTIWRMRISYWIPNGINTHTLSLSLTHTHTLFLSLSLLEFIYTNCFSTATLLARTYLSVTSYIHCMSCFFLNRKTMLGYHFSVSLPVCHFFFKLLNISVTINILSIRLLPAQRSRLFWLTTKWFSFDTDYTEASYNVLLFEICENF
jgi:hypothetical protein